MKKKTVGAFRRRQTNMPSFAMASTREGRLTAASANVLIFTSKLL